MNLSVSHSIIHLFSTILIFLFKSKKIKLSKIQFENEVISAKWTPHWFLRLESYGKKKKIVVKFNKPSARRSHGNGNAGLITRITRNCRVSIELCALFELQRVKRSSSSSRRSDCNQIGSDASARALARSRFIFTVRRARDSHNAPEAFHYSYSSRQVIVLCRQIIPEAGELPCAGSCRKGGLSALTGSDRCTFTPFF